jgi:hypothetical protein
MLMLAMLSLVGNLLYFILLAAAIQLVGIAPASLIVGVLPVTITLLGLKDEGALSLRHWPGRWRWCWPVLSASISIPLAAAIQPELPCATASGRTGRTGCAGQLELVCCQQCPLSAPAALL